MNLRSPRVHWLAPVLLPLVIPVGATAQVEFLPPSATAWNIGLRVIEPGLALDSAPYSVEFRPVGTTEWSEALPLRPVATRDRRTLFAGSILGVSEGTRYEIRIRAPYGADFLTTTAQTRMPPAPYDGRLVAVSPGGLSAALDVARPGDVLTLAAGVYEGPFNVARGGTATAPVTVVAAAGADVELRNVRGEIGAVIRASGEDNLWPDYVVLRDLTIRGHAPASAIRGGGSKGWVVSGCLVFGEVTLGRSRWWIEDNMIVGRYPTWDGARDPVPGGTGVHAEGTAHVIAHNQVSYFYDGINTADVFTRDAAWPFATEGPQRGVDIIGNLVFAARDDGIQVDHVGLNHRIHANRVFWAFAGISLQDFLPGPVYATRNVVTDVEWEAWKIMNATRGVHLYHNTSVSAFASVSTHMPGVRDARALNNVFAGKRGIHLGPAWALALWNHNGYVLSNQFPAVLWRADDGGTVVEYPTLADWTRATGHERDGVVLAAGEDLAGRIDFDAKDPPLDPANLVPTPSSRLRGRGEVVPTVSGVANSRPTIGAYAPGEPVPHYGPRRVVPGALYRGFYVDVDQLQLTAAPVGYSPLTVKEQIVRFIDVYNVSVPFIAGACFALGLLVGVLLGRRSAR